MHATHIIKFKMQRNPSQAISEIYNMNTSNFDDGQLEEFFALLRNFKIAIDRTGTTTHAYIMDQLSMHDATWTKSQGI